MKYSVHIGIGYHFSVFNQHISSHILMYGGWRNLDYFNLRALYWQSDGSVKLESYNLDPKSDMKIVPLSDKELSWINDEIVLTSDVEVQNYFTSLFNDIINVENVQNQSDLKICFYLPLWMPDLVARSVSLIKLLAQNENAFSFDIFGLAHDLIHIFDSDGEKVNSNKPPVEELRKDVQKSICLLVGETGKPDIKVSNFICLQNKRVDGIALNLDQKTFIKVIGEFIQVYGEHYQSIFSRIRINESHVTGLGLSEYYFDKYYFVNYLISKVYLSIMDREGVNASVADVNKLANQVNGVLNERFGSNINLLSHFWSEYIEKEINRGTPFNEIAEKAAPQIDSFIDDLGNRLQSFFTDQSYSLPEKRAALASLIGEDDELFVGQIYNQNVPTFDDCESEPVDYFVQLNNHLMTGGDKELETYACIKNEADRTGKVHLNLKEIKNLKNKIRHSTQTIRDLKSKMKKISDSVKKDEIAEKVLIEGNNLCIGERKFRLIVKPIEEQLLEVTYTPKDILPGEFDLRENFPSVKNQGSVGACSAFATVGVFEYIAHVKEVTRSYSESFVYFMARSFDRSNDKDAGSSIYNSIRALSEFGVCEKKVWDSLSGYSIEPDINAKDKAIENKVLEAANVQHRLHDIKSAVADGYPVCFGLKIFESFGKPTRGFVTSPNEEDLKQDAGYHSMIICGYSDKNRVFIVRNSWGKEFGDNGYCYIPYSYIENPRFFTQAFIIKEISVGSFFKIPEKSVVNFDTTDKLIEYAIYRNLIFEEKNDLRNYGIEYEYYRKKFIQITSELNRISSRQQLVEGESIYLNKKLEEAIKEKSSRIREKDEALSSIQHYAAKVFNLSLFMIGAISLIILLAFALLYFWDVFKSAYLWYGIVFISGLSIFLPLWKHIRNLKYRKVTNLWNEKIAVIDEKLNEIKQEKKLLPLRSNIAGQLHSKIFTLKQELLDKHKIMKSYVGNLREWYQNELENANSQTPALKFPFLNVIENAALDSFFDSKVEEVTSDLRLSDFIEKYELTEKGIIQFKIDLRLKVQSQLHDYINNFNFFNYVTAQLNFPYLSLYSEQTCRKMSKLTDWSKVFLQPKSYAANQEVNVLLAVNKPNSSQNSNWDKLIEECFGIRPIDVKLDSPDKILMIQTMDLNFEDLSIMT